MRARTVVTNRSHFGASAGTSAMSGRPSLRSCAPIEFIAKLLLPWIEDRSGATTAPTTTTTSTTEEREQPRTQPRMETTQPRMEREEVEQGRGWQTHTSPPAPRWNY